MKLSEINPGDTVTIRLLDGLSSDIRKKLMVMGLLPNTEVKVIRRAPMGDPLQVEVRGVSVALRETIAQKIEVERV
ncbi:MULTISPECIES: FeoA family protein [Vibrio]|mgnify:FL=1|jgi:ferrous iron transport protein A|nr:MULTISPECIES: FeoA family protein [Vibrio]EEZ81770.1 ferrous iron transport protein A [Vibrio alginolyticus 40B]MDW1807788.1 FeoA family protein [Vibrio sp. Vb2362]MDW1970730.1 FeoA family protein [Vibrio sp. 945]MDW2258861.1 FeoA family protein [Vibrio sp. 1409]MDW2295321.1 FeoA family protein [Vibrio sp. 1404]MEA3484861.1 FeoA family protein [Pseudomonadota bacterium]NAW54714.1 ferrous iron transport protein A [Vibrio sp. V41_P2S12T139]NAW96275.1 ferrous iron transport protein A [Vibri